MSMNEPVRDSSSHGFQFDLPLRVRRRLEQIEEARLRERAHPTVIGDGVAPVVVALDGDDGDARILQKLKPRERVVHRLRVYVATIEEVPRDDDEIHSVRQRVFLYHVIPTAEEILRTLFDIVTSATEVNVREV